jgi:hypothetical protein
LNCGSVKTPAVGGGEMVVGER